MTDHPESTPLPRAQVENLIDQLSQDLSHKFKLEPVQVALAIIDLGNFIDARGATRIDFEISGFSAVCMPDAEPEQVGGVYQALIDKEILQHILTKDPVSREMKDHGRVMVNPSMQTAILSMYQEE